MVLLDVNILRFLNKEHFRALTAVEMGMRNHDVVPTRLIAALARITSANIHSTLGQLAKFRLVRHTSQPYDGYRLTYMGYDYLALKALVNKGLIKGLGRQIGVGKESDIYEVINNNDEVLVLKIHRLGRICFRNIKEKRDYLGKRKHSSFMYMSRLAATREFAYLKAIYDEGFPTPTPYEINRHCILMSMADGYPMGAVGKLRNPEKVYNTLMNLVTRFAELGLIHGDFNEFNLLISRNEDVTVIDFPQMISTNHPNAEETFNRDVDGVHNFFKKKMGYDFPTKPRFVRVAGGEGGGEGKKGQRTGVNLDVALKVSGALTREEARDLDKAMANERAALLAGEYDDVDSDGEICSDEDGDEGDDVEEEEEEAELDEEDADADGDEDEDEDDEEEEEEAAVVRSRKQRSTTHGHHTMNANRRLRAHGIVDPAARDDDEDGVGKQILLTTAQLGGLELQDEDGGDGGGAVDLDGIPTLTDDDGDDAEDEDEDEDDEETAAAKASLVGAGRRKPRKVGPMGQAAVRARVREAHSKSVFKTKIKMSKNKHKEAKARREVREIKAMYK